MRRAKFNLGPVPRKHAARLAAGTKGIESNLVARDRKPLNHITVAKARAKSLAEDQHLESGARQHRPEALRGHQARDPERRQAHEPEEEERCPQGQRAVRPELDQLFAGVQGGRSLLKAK